MGRELPYKENASRDQQRVKNGAMDNPRLGIYFDSKKKIGEGNVTESKMKCFQMRRTTGCRHVMRI